MSQNKNQNKNQEKEETKKGILALKEEYEKEIKTLDETVNRWRKDKNHHMYEYVAGEKDRLTLVLTDLEELLK